MAANTITPESPMSEILEHLEYAAMIELPLGGSVTVEAEIMLRVCAAAREMQDDREPHNA